MKLKNFLIANKSGQATLIIVMVTLVAVLGIAASSSTQTSLNLRNTVYGIQSEQALGCAEAGAEELLGKYTDDDDGVNNASQVESISETLEESNCDLQATIADYPSNGSSDVLISRLNENSVQQLKVSRPIPNAKIARITPYDTAVGGDLAVYIYKPSTTIPTGTVERRLYHCGAGSAPTADFVTACENISFGSLPANSYVRLRALNNDLKIEISDFEDSSGRGVATGYSIESIGKAGTVERKVKAYRFYRQLPAFFDEAVVIFQ